MRNFLRMVPLLFGLTAVSRADLVLEFRGAQLTPCVDGLGCVLSADIHLLQPLPANLSVSSEDADLTLFRQYIDDNATAGDGLETIGGRFQADWPDTLSLSTDALAARGKSDEEVLFIQNSLP